MTDLEEIIKEYFLINPTQEAQYNSLTLCMKVLRLFRKLSHHVNLEQIIINHITNDLTKNDLNAQDGDGWVLLMFASRFADGIFAEKIIKLLLTMGSDVNIQNKNGNNVLSIYFYRNENININIIMLFIEVGINLNLLNNKNQTSFIYFIHENWPNINYSILDIFIENNAEINLHFLPNKSEQEKILVKNLIRDRKQTIELQNKVSELLAENRMLLDELQCHPDSSFVEEIKNRFDLMKNNLNNKN